MLGVFKRNECGKERYGEIALAHLKRIYLKFRESRGVSQRSASVSYPTIPVPWLDSDRALTGLRHSFDRAETGRSNGNRTGTEGEHDGNKAARNYGLRCRPKV